MRKEVLLAIVFGIILGGVILYGINIANKSISEIPATPTPAITNTITLAPENSSDSLKIQFPLDNSVHFEANITLKGTAKPGSNIAIITESDDYFSQSDPTGSFTSEIKLISGENRIRVVSIAPDEASSSAQITVIYTTTEI